jgi:type I restriction enzyme S subunit
MSGSWQIKPLGEFIEIRNGRNQQGVLSINGKYPILGSGGNVMGFATDYICEAGTTIIGRKGNICTPIYVNEKFWNVDTAFGFYPLNKNHIDKRFIYYLCLNIDFKSMNRGTTIPSLVKSELLKINIPVPPISDQQRIVTILDKAFAAIDKAKANTEKNLQNVRELFESYMYRLFESGEWEVKTVGEVCEEIFAGGDAPKNAFSLEPTSKFQIPIYANAVKDKGLYGYTDYARVNKPCVTIAARGSGTGHTELREGPFLPIVRLIVCLPDSNYITPEFLKYTLDNLVIERSGSAIPQLTVPMIKEYEIPIPSLQEQSQIINRVEIIKSQKVQLEKIYAKRIERYNELKMSILQKAFSGGLV